MPSCKDKKKAISSVFEGIALTTRHNQLHGTMAKGAIMRLIIRGLSKAQACEKQPYSNRQTHYPFSQTPQMVGDKDKSQERHEKQKSKEKCRL